MVAESRVTQGRVTQGRVAQGRPALGRPRSARADQAIRDATRKLLAQYYYAWIGLRLADGTAGIPRLQRELTKLVNYVDTGEAAGQKKRLADVFWTLLNSVEFRVNH